jgi:hypothetical protein
LASGEENIPMIESRVSRYSYGVVKTPAFDFNEHNPDDKTWDPAAGIWRAYQVEWLLKKVTPH